MARDWIEMLVELAREQDRAVPKDPRLDALVEGTLSDAEKLELEKEAASSVDSARVLAAFTPLDNNIKDRLVTTAHTVLTNPPTGERDPLDVPDDLDAMPEPEQRVATVAPAQSQWGFILLLIVAFAFAAAVAAYFAWPS